jgi:prepilin-type N-terminal cleavage/methylation domain-containing protein
MIGDNINKIKKEEAGFTLMEVLISISLFVVIILSVTSIFKLSIDGQRSAIATQNVQESLKYFLEVTAKEMRMAQKNNGVCTDIPDDIIFKIIPSEPSDILYFKNYYGECVRYFLADDGDNQRFKISRESNGETQSDFISPAKIVINNLNFVLNDAVSTTQPMVTINLNANAIGSGQFKSDMTLQTSVTSRYYK